ncbi:glycerate kinase [Brevibacillus migulae]|uniref:glycerate kinase n=1 Tax=Brevibacillus migulae TaxID=1644114 RepID=UPI00106E4A4D|nr:glycerate kinase [Brevibacillus migulae]
MKIVIAPDSFKGSLTAQEVGAAIKKGVQKAAPTAEVVVMPMADGGEGTLQCLIDATGGQLLETTVKNPLGKDITAAFGILGDGNTCVIEMAAASGLYLIEQAERNPLRTTTYGFGQLIKAGLDRGCRHFILGLGGSATNDGGAGMLQALGFALLDEADCSIGYGGGELGRIVRIRSEHADPRLADSTFVIACDVENPFVGPNGASFVFGPQKGADAKTVQLLDDHLRHFADITQTTTGVAIHDVPGTGAAGGVSGALLAFLGGTLKSGIDIVMETTGLPEVMQGADLVITGEGQVDFQTAQGKTPCGVARLARQSGIPTIVIAGSIGEGIEALYEQGVTAVTSIANRPMRLDEAMTNAAALLEQAAEQIMRIYCMARR